MQLFDTVIFVGVGFVLFGDVGPAAALSLVVGQYLLKLLIAVVDTPLVYAVVRVADWRGGDADATPAF